MYRTEEVHKRMFESSILTRLYMFRTCLSSAVCDADLRYASLSHNVQANTSVTRCKLMLKGLHF